MTERASSAIKSYAPWAAVALSVTMALMQFVRADSTQTEQMAVQAKRIEQLEDRKADRREVDDMKQWMKRIDDKLDRLIDKSDRR